MNVSALITVEFLGVALVFARIGGIMMFIPGLGESLFPVRHRLAMALVLSLALYPLVPLGPVDFDNIAAFFGVVAIELTLGIWVGMSGRVLLNGLQFAGHQIGMISGLANAFSPSLGSFEGANLVSAALMMAAVAVIFATDMHHLIIGAMVMSYDVFPPGQILAGDLAQQMVKAVSASFYMGLSIAAPFFVMGLLLNLAMGLTARMMPTLPVFFVAGPVLIASGLLVLVMASPLMLREFAERFADWLGLLVF